MSFSAQEGRLNAISVRRVYANDYGYAPFIPVDNGCYIDTAYKARIKNNSNCIE